MKSHLGVFLLAFALSALFSFVLKKYAVLAGLTAHPQEDRWHNRIIPLGGGVAIYLSFLIVAPISTGLAPVMREGYVPLMAVASGMFLLGLVDDRKSLRPYTKLLWQILAASVLILFGFQLRLTPWEIANFFLTLFWIVGITNAFNLLDNMDGLAAGIALIALCFRLLIFLSDGVWEGSMLCVVLMGALCGFLLFNFHPASIFMGDAGSLFVGFFMSGLVMTGVYPYTKALVSVLLLPVLILLIPIFDTALVAISRTLSRRPISVGGRDHVSHRLVAVGLSERRAVLLLYGMSAISGTVAFILYQIGFSYTVMGICVLSLSLICLGIYLHRIKVYSADSVTPNANNHLITVVNNFPYKRQVAQMFGDVVLISIAYYGAYMLRFETISGFHLQQYVKSLPLVITSQLVWNYLFGLYRRSWRYAGIRDLVAFLKATGMGTLVSVVLLAYLYHFAEFSRAVFVIYAMSLFLLTAGFRLSFRILDHLLHEDGLAAKKILIYGAGDGGELLLRELMRNRALNLIPVGFIDDDPEKQRFEIHGVRVFGDIHTLQKLLPSNSISEIVISTEKLRPEIYQTLVSIAEDFRVPVRKLKITLQ